MGEEGRMISSGHAAPGESRGLKRSRKKKRSSGIEGVGDKGKAGIGHLRPVGLERSGEKKDRKRETWNRFAEGSESQGTDHIVGRFFRKRLGGSGKPKKKAHTEEGSPKKNSRRGGSGRSGWKGCCSRRGKRTRRAEGGYRPPQTNQ